MKYKPRVINSLRVGDEVQLAGDDRSYLVLHVQAPEPGQGNFKVALRAADGASATLVRHSGEHVEVFRSPLLD